MTMSCRSGTAMQDAGGPLIDDESIMQARLGGWKPRVPQNEMSTMLASEDTWLGVDVAAIQ